MKTHTNNYKTKIKEFGRQIDVKIIYGLVELGAEDINYANLHYESSLLKSVMKQLDIDSNTEIPIGTEINYQFGLYVNSAFEYLNMGNYIVKDVEKQEDTNSYKITCYDKMLYAMKDYADMSITYPITIRNYIDTICSYLGLTFKNASDTFANYDKEISQELYLSSDGNSIGYTFRDVLDELAQVTASNICIDKDNKLEIRYMNDTNDTIDKHYLKDVNVNFGEKYGPINSIVLSRADESDNVYLRDEQSVLDDGLCEIKIKDNQIMNFNDRADYLQDILDTLDGLEYYYNDLKSTGITYYEVCDKYNVQIENNTYNCIMFNDEINVTQGLEENIHTDVAEESETEYQYASKDDRTRNQAYIIAKKNDAEIQALASKVVDLSKTITGIGSITLDNAYEGILHRLEIVGNIQKLAPTTTLTPSNTLIPLETILDVDGNKYKLDIDYLNYTSVDNHDTYVYEDGKQWIERADGTIENKSDILIEVSSNSVISMEYYNNAIFKSEYLLDNQYTDTFANQVTVSSELNLLADTLEAKVSQVADDDGNVTSASIILAVNNDTSQATIEADKININGIVTANENFKILGDGSMETKNATFSGLINGGAILVNGNFTESDPYIEVEHPNSTGAEPIGTTIWTDGISCYNYGGGNPVIRTETGDGYAELSGINIDCTGTISSVRGICQGSLEEKKKNFEKLENALDIIKVIDIYKYNYKQEQDDNKKHIGLVIGKNYNYSKEVTSNDNEEVDIYSFVSVCCQAIKELQKEIEDLKKEMKK